MPKTAPAGPASSPASAQGELEGLRAMFCATLQATTNAILVTDMQHRVVSFNDKYLALWAVPDSVMQTRDHLALVTAIESQFEAPDLYRAGIERIVGGAAASFDVLELRDGRSIERHSSQQLAAGKAIGRVWAFADVTANRSAHAANAGGPLRLLSLREREIFQLVVLGHSSARIGVLLCLSSKTVDTYRSRLMHKLGVGEVVSLVKYAIRHGMIAP